MELLPVFMKHVCVVLFCLIVPFSSIAQNTLSGKVIDSLTREPVAFASVYFANTSIGVTTNETGEFLLKDFASGKYDLITSFVGYKSIRVPLEFENRNVKIEIQLSQEATQLQEIVVKDYAQRPADIRRFERAFLGENSNAGACKILNLDDLVAYEDKDKNALIAFARDPLIIENKALGYKLIYTLESFEVNYTSMTQDYLGFPRFEELIPKNKSQERKWQGERWHAYEGSFVHLVHDLRKGILNRSFTLYELKKKPNPARPPEDFLLKKVHYYRSKYVRDRGTLNQSKDVADSMKYYVKLYNLPPLIDSLGKKFTNADELLDANREKIIYTGMLYVVYKGESEDPAYVRLNKKSHGKEQHSVIQFKKPVAIYDNGYYELIQDVFFDGYMMWSDRISNLLPRDYIPQSPVIIKN